MSKTTPAQRYGRYVARSGTKITAKFYVTDDGDLQDTFAWLATALEDAHASKRRTVLDQIGENVFWCCNGRNQTHYDEAVSDILGGVFMFLMHGLKSPLDAKPERAVLASRVLQFIDELRGHTEDMLELSRGSLESEARGAPRIVDDMPLEMRIREELTDVLSDGSMTSSEISEAMEYKLSGRQWHGFLLQLERYGSVERVPGSKPVAWRNSKRDG